LRRPHRQHREQGKQALKIFTRYCKIFPFTSLRIRLVLRWYHKLVRIKKGLFYG
jgi:hypothetical protein